MTALARALVTGAAGFIGSHLVRYLAESEWLVRALDARSVPATRVGAPAIEYWIQDLRDRAALERALDGIDIVFHLASLHLDVHAHYEDFEAVNVKAVEQLLQLCAAARIKRVVHVSSVGVYGHVGAPPAKEDAPLNPENDYERTKLAGEEAARRCADRYGLDIVILRPSWVYGAGCPRTEKLLSAVRKRRFFYIGSTTNLRHPLYIADFLAAMVLAAGAGPEIAGRTFNIAGPSWMTVEQMVTTFAAAVGAPPPSVRIPRWLGLSLGWTAEQVSAVTGIHPPISRRTLAFFENDNAFDISAARTMLGFEPKTELLDGVRQIVHGTASAATSFSPSIPKLPTANVS